MLIVWHILVFLVVVVVVVVVVIVASVFNKDEEMRQKLV